MSNQVGVLAVLDTAAKDLWVADEYSKKGNPAARESKAALDAARAAIAELIEAGDELMAQYDSSGDFTMGGNLTNSPFFKTRAALAKVKGPQS